MTGELLLLLSEIFLQVCLLFSGPFSFQSVTLQMTFVLYYFGMVTYQLHGLQSHRNDTFLTELLCTCRVVGTLRPEQSL